MAGAGLSTAAIHSFRSGYIVHRAHHPEVAPLDGPPPSGLSPTGRWVSQEELLPRRPGSAPREREVIAQRLGASRRLTSEPHVGHSWVVQIGTLYLRCVAWGLATGASTGGLFGVITIWGVGAGRRDTVMPSLVDAFTGTAFGALLGALIGTMVSVIPSLVGGLVVTGLIGHGHPGPAAIQRDLRRIFAVFVLVLNTALLLAIFTLGKGVSSLTSIVPYILVGDVWVTLMLRQASASIGRRTVADNLKSEQQVLADASPKARAW